MYLRSSCFLDSSNTKFELLYQMVNGEMFYYYQAYVLCLILSIVQVQLL
jgi:hypothetical protein